MARYLTDSQALFTHIPRTGGNSVEVAIELCGLKFERWLEKQPPWICKKHALLSHYRTHQMPKIHHVFTFVRHPVSYYISIWKWLCHCTPAERRRVRKGTKWSWHPKAVASRLWSACLDEWVERMLKAEPCWVTRLYEMYCGPQNGEFCFFIGRTESLMEDFISVLGLLGYDNLPLERLRNLPPQHKMITRSKLHPDLEQEILKTERLALKRFYEGTALTKRIYRHDEMALPSEEKTVTV